MQIGMSPMEKGLTAMAERDIQNLVRKHLKTATIWTKMKDDPYLRGMWEMSDYILRTKMHFNAHGDTHAKVVAANALKILDILVEHFLFDQFVPHPGVEQHLHKNQYGTEYRQGDKHIFKGIHIGLLSWMVFLLSRKSDR